MLKPDLYMVSELRMIGGVMQGGKQLLRNCISLRGSYVLNNRAILAWIL